MNSSDKVSIIIPAYNAEDTIEKCLNSLVAQTYKNLELIIVNDGSKDNTENLIKSFFSKLQKAVAPYIYIYIRRMQGSQMLVI